MGEHNSFSKTDPDATMKHMKYDYYNHTHVFKYGYNLQIRVNHGYVAYTYISADANDMKTYIPFKRGEIRKQAKTLISSRFKDSGQTGYK